MLRWAAELAGANDQLRAQTGVVALNALLSSELLDRADVDLVAAVLDPFQPESMRAGAYDGSQEVPDV